MAIVKLQRGWLACADYNGSYMCLWRMALRFGLSCNYDHCETQRCWLALPVEDGTAVRASIPWV